VKRQPFARSLVTGLLFLLPACKAPTAVKDYERFYASAPYTIVVLMPENSSVDAEAPRFFLSTITRPLVDRGYYVVPVEVVADMMAAEGLAEGGALREVNPKKFREYFGADAILYISIKEWSTSYIVLASSVTVSMDYRLVHTDSGDVLWEESARHVRSSGNGGSGVVGLIGMLVEAIVTATTTSYVDLAREANLEGLKSLPPGPYHTEFARARQQHLARVQAARRQDQAAQK
jgi:hypothetical protein